MSERTLRARAKVNLHLRVHGRRPDGYHELTTVFDRLSLSDLVQVATRPRTGIELTCVDKTVPNDDRNLAWRAAAAALETAGSAAGVSIRLHKGIPVGGGLGGGSSDAAATLIAVNEALGLGIGPAALLTTARDLGADVPFFTLALLKERDARGEAMRMAVGRGVGEILEPVPNPAPAWYVLANPGFEVSTAWAFDEARFPPLSSRAPADAQSFADLSTFEGLVRSLRNDLEPVVSARHPEIATLKGRLLSLGAAAAQMSGSGPTVFGLFPDLPAADDARRALESVLQGSGTRVFIAQGE